MTSDLTSHQLTAARPPIAIDYHPIDGPAQQLLVSGEQLHANACLYCGSEQQLHTAGHAYTHSGGLGWVVVACAAHLTLAREQGLPGGPGDARAAVPEQEGGGGTGEEPGAVALDGSGAVPSAG
ncbi:hypothetical protein ACIGXM_19450 [Kitasatospora sp. NPDC052896]|uniref:hypothetical protein n=1 Tax=Kitasatospora sp. NPDC052896 TaxID=3364061 RepID=UPI0037CAB7BF